MLISLRTSAQPWPLARQTPACSSRWGDDSFQINTESDACDACVVYEQCDATFTVSCPAGRVILVTAEPPGVKRYDQRFLNQFAVVVSCQTLRTRARVIHQQQGLPWHIGLDRTAPGGTRVTLDYDALRDMSPSPKSRLLSVVCSSKSMTPGHRARLRFLERLKTSLGDHVDLFGRGFREIPDKWDALAPYHYHLAMENCSVPHYWTEKLADAYLARCLPLYHGCPNLADYFPPDSYVPLDITQPHAAVDLVQRVITATPTTTQRQAIEAARGLVLDRYNLFPMLSQLCAALPAGEMRRITIHPQRKPWSQRIPGPLRGLLRRVLRH